MLPQVTGRRTRSRSGSFCSRPLQLLVTLGIVAVVCTACVVTAPTYLSISSTKAGAVCPELADGL